MRAIQVFAIRCAGLGFQNRFREGLVCKAHRRVYHSTLGSRAMKKKKKVRVHRLVVLGARLGEIEEGTPRPRPRQVVQILVNYNLFGNESPLSMPILFRYTYIL